MLRLVTTLSAFALAFATDQPGPPENVLNKDDQNVLIETHDPPTIRNRLNKAFYDMEEFGLEMELWKNKIREIATAPVNRRIVKWFGTYQVRCNLWRAFNAGKFEEHEQRAERSLKSFWEHMKGLQRELPLITFDYGDKYKYSKAGGFTSSREVTAKSYRYTIKQCHQECIGEFNEWKTDSIVEKYRYIYRKDERDEKIATMNIPLYARKTPDGTGGDVHKTYDVCMKRAYLLAQRMVQRNEQQKALPEKPQTNAMKTKKVYKMREKKKEQKALENANESGKRKRDGDDENDEKKFSGKDDD